MPYWIDCSIFSQSGKTCPWLVLLGRQFTGFENNNSNENIGNEGDDWCQWFWFERESAALCLIQIGTVDWLAGRRCRRSGEVFYSSKADWKRTLCIICIQGTFSLLPPQGGDWGGAYCLSSISYFAFFQIHISGFSRTKVSCKNFPFDAINQQLLFPRLVLHREQKTTVQKLTSLQPRPSRGELTVTFTMSAEKM